MSVTAFALQELSASICQEEKRSETVRRLLTMLCSFCLRNGGMRSRVAA